VYEYEYVYVDFPLASAMLTGTLIDALARWSQAQVFRCPTHSPAGRWP